MNKLKSNPLEIDTYKINDGLVKIMHELGYTYPPSQPVNWMLYTRKEENDFVALYNARGCNEYIIWGPIKDIETTKKDLEHIANDYFSESRFIHFVRTKGKKVLVKAFPAVFLGSLLYLGLTDDPNTPMNIFLVYSGLFAANDFTATGINNRRLSKLSPEANDYLFGVIAEKRLIKEHEYNKMDGKEKKELFLDNITEDLRT